MRPANGRTATPGNGLVPAEADIYADIHSAIVEQQLTPGTKLTEDVLAGLYRTTRARIRRVLLTLAHDRLVDLLPARGAFVATLSPGAARDVFAARQLLETALMRTLRAPPAVSVMEGLTAIAKQEHRARHRHDRREMIRLSADFHVALAAGLGNPVLAEMLEHLVARTSVIIAMYEAVDGGCCLADDHDRLLDVIGLGSGDIAAQMMKHHLNSIEAGLLLESPHPGVVDIRVVLAQSGLRRAC